MCYNKWSEAKLKTTLIAGYPDQMNNAALVNESGYLRRVGLRAGGDCSLCACLNDIRGCHHHIKLTCGNYTRNFK